MTNIWADTFSAIREPFFEEKKEKEEKGEKKHKEGPAEEKAEEKKGEKEKEKENEKPKRWWDDDGDGKGWEKGEVEGSFKKRVKKEEVEQIDEISQKLATKAFARRATGEFEYDTDPSNYTKSGEYKSDLTKRRIVKKFGKKAGDHAERAAHSSIFGRKGVGGMPKVSEERELHSKNDKNEKLDVRKGIHNKINTKPTVSEEVEAWIDELLSEGYDLSNFTLDEIVDIYESAEVEQLDEADTYGMPPKGDAERQKQDPMAAAKAKAARAKVAKERADFQVAQQAQRMKVSTTESVIAFVESRTPLFEGVYDPKKSKLRPASERTKRVMTDAQRKAAKKEAERTAEIHSKGETVLAGLRSSGKGKVKTTAPTKSAAPAANRKVKGKYDKLASAADKILKDLQK